MTVFDIKDGERFEWNHRTYTLIRIEDDGPTAYVTEDGVEGEQRFNPYAPITKIS